LQREELIAFVLCCGYCRSDYGRGRVNGSRREHCIVKRVKSSCSKAGGVIQAAEYVRMSREHQRYSIENQTARIREYASQRGFEVIKTYADDGKSGLDIEGRPSLQRLIDDVETGRAAFTLVLVYDVSRWGRFQDVDDGAYYEVICRKAGVQIVYCAEEFENDGSAVSTIVKTFKRVNAGQFSRDLSTKVSAGKRRLIRKGFRQGGQPGYALRRMVVDENGTPKGSLTLGEQKFLQTDRVILIPGPDEEVQLVRQIYQWFVKDGLSATDITRHLNEIGLRNAYKRPWTYYGVREILTNEKYIGNNVSNRTSARLRQPQRRNPREEWVRKEGAFTPLVSKEDFDAVQRIIRERHPIYSDDELIAGLRTLYERHGLLSIDLIESAEDIPCTCSKVYSHRFGDLTNAYKLAGYRRPCDTRFIEINRLLRRLHPSVVEEIEQRMATLGGTVRRDPATGVLEINGELRIALVVTQCERRESGFLFWKVFLQDGAEPDLTVVTRLTPNNDAAMDYFLFPTLLFRRPALILHERNPIDIERFRFTSLDYLCGMAARTVTREAA